MTCRMCDLPLNGPLERTRGRCDHCHQLAIRATSPAAAQPALAKWDDEAHGQAGLDRALGNVILR